MRVILCVLFRLPVSRQINSSLVTSLVKSMPEYIALTAPVQVFQGHFMQTF